MLQSTHYIFAGVLHVQMCISILSINKIANNNKKKSLVGPPIKAFLTLCRHLMEEAPQCFQKSSINPFQLRSSLC